MTSPYLVAALREKAKEYELNALAAKERQEPESALAFSTLAISFFEIADLIEQELEEAA